MLCVEMLVIFSKSLTDQSRSRWVILGFEKKSAFQGFLDPSKKKRKRTSLLIKLNFLFICVNEIFAIMSVSFNRIGCSLLLFGISAHAFVPSIPSKLHSSPAAVIGNSRLFGFGRYDSFESSRYEDALARNKARTDVRNFLTQRAIQSFVYLLNQCRDPHTVNWMEVSHKRKLF